MQISRKTVKKYIDEYQSENTGTTPKARHISKPKYRSKTGVRKKRSLTPEVAQTIDSLLADNAQKQLMGKHKQCMKGKDIHEYLSNKGYEVGYTTVCNYIRNVKQQSQEVYIRQSYGPGNSVEFDWCEVKLDLQGAQKRVMMAVFTCCYSNYRKAYLFYRQDMQSFLQAHVHFFEDFGHVPREIVYDNMRVAVSKFSYNPKEKQATDSLLKLSSYYLFEYRFCNVYRGNEKGSVERSVEYIRRKAFCTLDEFDDLSAANTHLSATCERLNQQTPQGKTASIATLAQAEKTKMRPAKAAYDIGELLHLKLNKYHCFCYSTNYYSVPESITDKQVAVKVYPEKLVVYAIASNKIVAEHQRASGKNQWYIRIEHYLDTLTKKPGAVTNSTALKQSDSWIKNLFEQHFKKEEKQFIQLLQLQRSEQIPITDLQKAVKKCLQISPNTPIDVDKIKLLLKDTANGAAEPTEKPQESKHSTAIKNHCRQQLKEHQTLFKAHS